MTQNCGQPNPFDGLPCEQEAAYLVVARFHGLPGERTVEVCADHLAYWREAFPESVVSARSLSANGPSNTDQEQT